MSQMESYRDPRLGCNMNRDVDIMKNANTLNVAPKPSSRPYKHRSKPVTIKMDTLKDVCGVRTLGQASKNYANIKVLIKPKRPPATQTKSMNKIIPQKSKIIEPREDQLLYHVTRGPQLIIKSKNGEILLQRLSNDETGLRKVHKENFDDFASTSKCMDMKELTLINNGTTTIRFQWLRAPPGPLAQEFLGNASNLLEFGKDVCAPNEKKNEEGETNTENQHKVETKNFKSPFMQKIINAKKLEYMKPHCQEFIFCELPKILLPGQKLQFEIMFRPQRPGFYTETIYLLTHPHLTETAFSLNLTGICVDPDNIENGTKDSSITKGIYEKMYQRQGYQALAAIVDHVVNFNANEKSTLPFGRVNSEMIFKGHNKELHYHSEAANRGLELIRTLIQLLVTKESLQDRKDFCHLNIIKLYQELLKPESEQEYFKDNLASDQVEELLSELNTCINELIRPRIFRGLSADEQILTGTYATVRGMVAEVLSVFGEVGSIAKNPFATYVWRKVIHGKLSVVRQEEIDKAIELRKDKERKQLQAKYDAETQTNSKESLIQPVPAPALNDDDDEEILRQSIPKLKNSDVEHQIRSMTRESIAASRRHAAEDIMVGAIERMLSVIDSMENSCNYPNQEAIFSASGNFCC